MDLIEEVLMETSDNDELGKNQHNKLDMLMVKYIMKTLVY